MSCGFDVNEMVIGRMWCFPRKKYVEVRKRNWKISDVEKRRERREKWGEERQSWGKSLREVNSFLIWCGTFHTMFGSNIGVMNFWNNKQLGCDIHCNLPLFLSFNFSPFSFYHLYSLSISLPALSPLSEKWRVIWSPSQPKNAESRESQLKRRTRISPSFFIQLIPHFASWSLRVFKIKSFTTQSSPVSS